MINAMETRAKSVSLASSHALGRYRLIAKIASGGMADVYLAVTEGAAALTHFRKLLVIKMLKRELCEDVEFVKIVPRRSACHSASESSESRADAGSVRVRRSLLSIETSRPRIS